MLVDLFSIGPITVHSYGLMIAIGIISTFIVTEYRSKKAGIDPEPVFMLGVIGISFGVVGAKILYWITILPEIIEDPSLLLDVSNGFVVYGGIITGLLAPYVYCKKKKLSYIKYLDAAAPTIALAQGFGRVGCLMAGCCYGKETDAWYGITFHHTPYAPCEVALIPTQLISSILNFAHFFLLVFLTKRVKKDGQVGALYLIFYSFGRFFVETLRADFRGSVGIFSTSQLISIFIFVIGIVLFIVLGKRENAPFVRWTPDKAKSVKNVSLDGAEALSSEDMAGSKDMTNSLNDDDSCKTETNTDDGADSGELGREDGDTPAEAETANGDIEADAESEDKQDNL